MTHQQHRHARHIDPVDPIDSPPGARPLLHHPHHRADRDVVRGRDLALHAPAADRRQNTHALRRRKRQIKPPHPIAAQRAPQRLARARIQARQQPPESLARALARQPQLTRRLTPPHARPLPRRQVVVLHPATPLRNHRIRHQRVVIGDRLVAPDRARPHHRARPPARPSAATAPIVTDANTDDHQKPPSATNATLADSILECKGLLRGDFAWLLSAQRLSPLPDPDGRPQLLTAREGAH